MPQRPCLGCGRLTSRRGSRCSDCASAKGKARDARRGSRQARGYDAVHDALREQWRPKVETGRVRCARCGELIPADQAWALDHTDDRTGYLGPSHTTCNAAAGGRAAH